MYMDMYFFKGCYTLLYYKEKKKKKKTGRIDSLFNGLKIYFEFLDRHRKIINVIDHVPNELKHLPKIWKWFCFSPKGIAFSCIPLYIEVFFIDLDILLKEMHQCNDFSIYSTHFRMLNVQVYLF